MRFFIPHAKDEKTENIWRGVKKFAEQTTAWPVGERKVYRLEFVHEGTKQVACVGKQLYGEEVIVILESVTYLVCTPNRGVLRGLPILVGKNEVIAIEFFD